MESERRGRTSGVERQRAKLFPGIFINISLRPRTALKRLSDSKCGDNQGFVSMFDIRLDEPVTSLQVHQSSVSSMVFSSKVPNMLVTSSEDEHLKVWDVGNGSIEFVHQKKLKIVIKFCHQLNLSDIYIKNLSLKRVQ